VSDIPQRRIRSAADLLAALADPDAGIRLAVLQRVARQPETALAYGVHDGRDVLDALAQEAGADQGTACERVAMAALAAFRDPRVVRFFMERLAESERVETLLLAVARLRHEPVEPLRDPLVALLMTNAPEARPRAAAELLRQAAGLPAAARLRVALITGKVPAPAPDEETTGFWLAELEGPFRTAARRAAQAHGPGAFEPLKAHWDSLSPGNQEWLLLWGAEEYPPEVRELQARALESGSERLALAALRSITHAEGKNLEPGAGIDRFLAHGAPELRLAAIQAGARHSDWRAFIKAESEPAVRRAGLARLAAEEEAVPDLVAALADPDWGMRAVATEALSGMDDRMLEAVERLVRHPDAAVRTAAAQVLLARGREDWLEEVILT
jgi:hypothetical protein